MGMKVLFENPKVKEFVSHFERNTKAKIDRFIYLLSMISNKLGMPYSKRISKNLYELRIRGNCEVRILYCFHRNCAVLVRGFVKKTRKTPSKEIEIALNRIKRLTSI